MSRQKYYPSGNRTYLRIVPIDSIQAAADLMAMKQAGCTKVAVANDKEAYGAGLATLLGLEKGFYGVNIVSDTGIDPTAPNFRSYASTIKGQGADCFYFAGIICQRRRPDHQGRPLGDPHRQGVRRRRGVHGHLHQRDEGRHPGLALPADPVHDGDFEPVRVPGW